MVFPLSPNSGTHSTTAPWSSVSNLQGCHGGCRPSPWPQCPDVRWPWHLNVRTWPPWNHHRYCFMLCVFSYLKFLFFKNSNYIFFKPLNKLHEHLLKPQLLKPTEHFAICCHSLSTNYLIIDQYCFLSVGIIYTCISFILHILYFCITVITYYFCYSNSSEVYIQNLAVKWMDWGRTGGKKMSQ